MVTNSAPPRDLRANDDPAKKKKLSARGEAARARLKRAALKVMEETGYHRVRIHDITTEAGVAAGLFYHYFNDLKSLVLEVLDDYIAESRNINAIEHGIAKGDWYSRMYAHFELVVNSYAERPGLMRCLLQMADEDEIFAAKIRCGYVEQLNWLVQRMNKLFPRAEIDSHQALLVVYTLASSGEMILRDYFINRDERLHAKSIKRSELTELLTVMFYRGIFLEHPAEEKLLYSKNLQHMKKNDNQPNQ